MTGGTSRVPFVQNLMREIYGSEKILFNVNADESVCRGASRYGTLLLRNSSLLKLFHVLTDQFELLIKRKGEGIS